MERRDKETRARAAHLVDVPDDGGKPLFVKDLGGQPRLLEIEHVPVTVVVVPGVFLIDPGHACAFPWKAEGLVVPVGDHFLSVGIGARNDQHDDSFEDLFDFGRVAGDEIVSEFHGHLTAGGFGGVKLAVDEQRHF